MSLKVEVNMFQKGVMINMQYYYTTVLECLPFAGCKMAFLDRRYVSESRSEHVPEGSHD